MPGGEEGTNQDIGRRKRSGKVKYTRFKSEVGSKGEQVGHIQCRKPFMCACTITSHDEFISK